jgi:Fic family protein
MNMLNMVYMHPMVTRLSHIAALRESILHIPLGRRPEDFFAREQLVRAVHASTALEGNPLLRADVRKIADGEDVSASERDTTEVKNYLRVLEHIESYQTDGSITVEDLLALHRDITQGTLDNPKDVGAFRKVKIEAGNRITKLGVYPVPLPKYAILETKGLINWLDSTEQRMMLPILVAGIAHYEIMRIYPFTAGNGRTARALATLILAKKEFDPRRFFTLDDLYNRDHPAYFGALRGKNGKYPELMTWLEYFTTGAEISLHRVKEQVLMLYADDHYEAPSGQALLSKHQTEIIDFIKTNGSIHTSDLVSRYHIQRYTAVMVLTEMVDRGLIQRREIRRGMNYVLI